MSATTRDEVLEVLGDVDDLIVERIIATGATTAEIGAALDAHEDARGFGEARLGDDSPRVAAVREILDELLDDDEDEAPGQEASP
jgi:hypothetical protein